MIKYLWPLFCPYFSLVPPGSLPIISRSLNSVCIWILILKSYISWLQLYTCVSLVKLAGTPQICVARPNPSKHHTLISNLLLDFSMYVYYKCLEFKFLKLNVSPYFHIYLHFIFPLLVHLELQTSPSRDSLLMKGLKLNVGNCILRRVSADSFQACWLTLVISAT